MGGIDRVLGTPGFAAPEQMQGKGVSPAAGIFACCRPKWEALLVDADQRCVIRMEGMERELNGAWVTLPKEGHYTYPGPLVSNPGPEPYRKPGEACLSFGYFRRPFVVAGPGALKVPLIVGHDVYLVSNATLVTSGTLPTNDFTRTLLKRDYPTDSNGHSLLFPTFHVEPGSRVIFTETPRYPQVLIDCPKDSIRTLSFRSDPFL